MSYVYEARDAYWGQLSGCLEAINCGTTLVLDHAHIVYTPEHGKSYCVRLVTPRALTPSQPTLHCQLLLTLVSAPSSPTRSPSG